VARYDERSAATRMLESTFTNLEALPAIPFGRPRFSQPLEAVAL